MNFADTKHDTHALVHSMSMPRRPAGSDTRWPSILVNRTLAARSPPPLALCVLVAEGELTTATASPTNQRH